MDVQATSLAMNFLEDPLLPVHAEAQCVPDIHLHLPEVDSLCALELPTPETEVTNLLAQCPPLEIPGLSLTQEGPGPTMIRTRSSLSISAIVTERLQFGMDVLKQAPRMMVLENQTPWCHRQLYKDGMPRSMQDAVACCALYMARNEINAPVILSSFKTRIDDLLASPPPKTPLEALAHTQSLILYQIMRLFDGDIHARLSAEPLIPMLETSAFSLLNYVYFPAAEPDTALTAPMDAVMQSWTEWVYQESARRTALFTFYLVQIYRLVTGENNLSCDGRLGLIHSWYLSAYLWSAQTAFDFAVAWNENQHFVVCNADFGHVLERARPSDVDVFGRMLLSTLLGIDQVKAWFYSRGAIL
ncbi:hypothetical protein CBS115989_6722 [Aspergillus niger]|uniref:Contig An09c0100, genomic contig n=5 Tax=Aspergillus niger TaxID=5061 RepID=A2QTY5_ASPNC|nr:uncharacterized protein An09g03710 [Aspergillus niger]KAI2816644.1 hypothetical protein CBS115989_6722 [Aspergillus niger]KAI2830834.1 hypothetical protein CBS133816_2968 [Aspergillus niger]KAI2839375.1 hypothetical protein CBS11350_7630 [Aspergillus niger]KAI2851024.1 hypothetical protein CBS11232_6173 [Aspergillus niger]KAI2867515.1 hypothetical protein CBS12448_480 [Aspergillus niger]